MAYDLVVVGGGLGGAALATVMARTGAQVLVVEREARFRDRVHGEGIFPWGCAEAEQLGLLGPLREACGHDVGKWSFHPASGVPRVRDFASTTASGLGMVNFRHEAMQTALLDLAEASGADVLRAAEATGVTPGARPSVTVRSAAGTATHSCRLVVGADGRASRMRQWGGFCVKVAPDMLRVSSTIYANMPCPADSIHVANDPATGRVVLVYPVGDTAARTYLIHRAAEPGPTFSGASGAAPFLDACRSLIGSTGWLDDVRQDSILGSFNAASTWVEFPYRDGIALIGDAAGSSDPAYGSGLAMTLRDVRHLSECLTAESDWALAASQYAQKHDRDFGALKRNIDWRIQMTYATGPEADADRARAQKAWQEDPSRVPDFHGLGPDAPSDETARRRYFGLE